MVFANLLFDGLTMVVTFKVLAAAVRRSAFMRIPAFIVLDLVLAGLLAIGSLYFGTVKTVHALPLLNMLHILIGRSPDGSHWQFGPYFWVMHTTFLPTLACLLLILICWFGRALLIPVHRFFGKAAEHEHPLKLTAALMLGCWRRRLRWGRR